MGVRSGPTTARASKHWPGVFTFAGEYDLGRPVHRILPPARGDPRCYVEPMTHREREGSNRRALGTCAVLAALTVVLYACGATAPASPEDGGAADAAVTDPGDEVPVVDPCSILPRGDSSNARCPHLEAETASFALGVARRSTGASPSAASRLVSADAVSGWADTQKSRLAAS